MAGINHIDAGIGCTANLPVITRERLFTLLTPYHSYNAGHYRGMLGLQPHFGIKTIGVTGFEPLITAIVLHAAESYGHILYHNI